MKHRGGPVFRILVFDDYQPFRRYLCLALQKRADFQVIGEASDGLEAAQKAQDLQPGLILLDVSLPRLNGLEAAARIRRVAPLAKILFVSQEFSFEMVEVALRLGAMGYVHKLRAGSDLLPGTEAILRGKYFVSGIMKGGPGGAGVDRPAVRHEVQFCSDDETFLESSTDFIAASLKGGKAAIVIANESHRVGVLKALNGRSLDVEEAIKRRLLTPLDDAKALSAIMVNDMPDPARFFDAGDGLIEVAAEAATRNEFPRVAVCRECPTVLLAGEMPAVLQLEQLWNIKARTSTLDILCVYPSADFENHKGIFQSICAEHSSILPA